MNNKQIISASYEYDKVEAYFHSWWRLIWRFGWRRQFVKGVEIIERINGETTEFEFPSSFWEGARTIQSLYLEHAQKKINLALQQKSQELIDELNR